MTQISPYGDARDDGLVQVSFTLPIAASDRARAAALNLVDKMGFENAQVVHMKAIGPQFTYLIVYGRTSHTIDLNEVTVQQRSFPLLSHQEVNRLIQEHLGRRLVVVGATTGTDAHTVGLDAILSVKGVAGDHGLEHFSEIRVVNMGAQVTPDDLASAVRREQADAVLISQAITQRNAHVLHLVLAREALIDAGLRGDVVLVGGGPRFEPHQADELGYDQIFGPRTLPSEVASYVVSAVLARHGVEVPRPHENPAA